MECEKTLDVIIPVYKPDEAFRKLITRLERQTYPIRKIILMNTEREYWNKEYIKGYDNLEVHHITKKNFDHGGTRKAAAQISTADIMVFMTQDALPYDENLLAQLVAALGRTGVKAAYARQLPNYDCRILEQYTRSYNYPEESSVKSLDSLKTLGIKTYFCSNVCAAYDKSTYTELGGFVTKTIFNEDMIFGSKVIQAGYRIAYEASAQVIHSHNYNCRQQFHRNFDLGVSQAQYYEVFRGIPSEGEGIHLVAKTAAHVCSIGKPWLIIPLFFQSAFKYMGYWLGKRYKKLPKKIILWCTMNKEYWTFYV